MDLFKIETKIDFMAARKPATVVAALLVVASIVLLIARGLNFGIDFTGGLIVEVGYPQSVELEPIRETMAEIGFGNAIVQHFGTGRDVLIRIAQQEGGDAAQQAAIQQVRQALGDAVEYRRIETVGPTVSAELARAGTIAVLVAIFAIMAYIWFRFEWQFAIGAVVALVHDVVLTIGMFSLLQLDFALASIAAILTIVGYSLNDTVVVYDRVRENLRRFKKMPMVELLDVSINQMLQRTVMTSLTTLLALGALYVLGGEVIRTFVFAMIWGVLVGTYSSVYIAAPVLLYFGMERGTSEAAEAAQPAE
jgi:preprotein translocase subunit SecF